MTQQLILEGLRVVDFSALGPGPFASRVLAAYGADVIAVEAPTVDQDDAQRMFGSNKRSIVLDLKHPAGIEVAKRLAAGADVVIESMRPGKMEGLGLGPEVLTTLNGRLIYARLTAFGQDGPLSRDVGHDINAIAIGGALALVGLDQPLPPGGLVGDFASGAMMVVTGVLLAVIRRHHTGRGGVIDAAMSDGAAMLAGGMLPLLNKKQLGPRGTNLVDGSRPFYTTYRCADGRWMAVGAIEPKFFANLVRLMELEGVIDPARQYDPAMAGRFREVLAARFAERPRDEWVERLRALDSCATPVLEPNEVASHPHHRARESVIVDAEGVHGAVAPRLDGVTHRPPGPAPRRGADTHAVLRDAGFDGDDFDRVLASGGVHRDENID